MKVRDNENTKGIRVFVYGTLKEGHGNHGAYLKDNDGAELLGRCLVSGDVAIRDLGYFPCAVKTTDGVERSILGEVYLVNIQTLDALDGLEGHPDWYVREKVNTPWKGAWCYFMPDREIDGDEHTSYIASGIWNATDAEVAWLKEAS